MSIIQDGTGTGNTLKVNEENKLESNAIIRPLDQHINSVHQKMWSLPFDAIDPVGADDYFIYIENTGIENLRSTDVRLRSTVIGTVEIHRVSGTASYAADTDITPVSRFLGSAKSPTAILKTDTNTTGLANEGILFYIRLDTADKDEHLRTSSNLIIPPGQKLALLWDTSTGALSGIVSLVEEA